MSRAPAPKTPARDAAKRAKAEAYRRVIADAAQKVFAEHGFEAAKIQDIAQEAGLSLGTLYTVFPGKAEIYSAIQREHGQAVLLEISSAVARVHGELDAALAGIEAYVRCLVARPHYLRMLLREGLSWTQRSWLRTADEIATWERGMTLAVFFVTYFARSFREEPFVKMAWINALLMVILLPIGIILFQTKGASGAYLISQAAILPISWQIYKRYHRRTLVQPEQTTATGRADTIA